MKPIWLDKWEKHRGGGLYGIDRYRGHHVAVHGPGLWQGCWTRSHDRRIFYAYRKGNQTYILGKIGRGFIITPL